MSKKRLEVRLSGRVQGVSFRYYTRKKAGELGLVGWVRNEPDGDVQVVAEGDEGVLKQLLEYLKTGPSFAEVEQCEPQWSEARDAFHEFRVRH